MNIDNDNKNYLEKTELTVMANIMSDAFLTHANFVYLIKDENRRKKALYNIFLLMYKVINKYGFISVVETENTNIGYITFMDASDKAQISFCRVIRTRGLLNAVKFIFKLKISEIKKLIRYMNTYNKYQKSESSKGKIHLYSTGINPQYKGKGYMGKAIRDSFIYFKDIGYSEMVLETSDLTNIPIYEKLGFVVDEYIKTKDELQTICFMTKKLN